jgi:uncharacterized RDD family membrane protein YckC
MTAISADSPLSTAQQLAQAASLGELLFRRWLATMLDAVLIAAVLWAVVYGGRFVFGAPALAPAIWAWLAALVLYFPITEGLWGRTLGKYAASLSVIDAAGRPPGVGPAAIRSFVRIVEVNPLLCGAPAAIAIAVSRDRQRLGDYAAHTYVVPTEALTRALDDPASVFD